MSIHRFWGFIRILSISFCSLYPVISAFVCVDSFLLLPLGLCHCLFKMGTCCLGFLSFVHSYFFFNFFFFLAAQHVESQFPAWGSNPYLLLWQHGVLTTGLPGKSLFHLFLQAINFLLTYNTHKSAQVSGSINSQSEHACVTSTQIHKENIYIYIYTHTHTENTEHICIYIYIHTYMCVYIYTHQKCPRPTSNHSTLCQGHQF